MDDHFYTSRSLPIEADQQQSLRSIDISPSTTSQESSTPTGGSSIEIVIPNTPTVSNLLQQQQGQLSIDNSTPIDLTHAKVQKGESSINDQQSEMPYRTELRRPDLKGTFRCSLCNKIFCHSSSLSRHRMQAHFKSYTCTLCNKEITSNETLRAHMYKKHQISRMFMCRCCNWAFPDKTSLHIHMQAMATGNPGNVSIIAKSSTSPPPGAALIAQAALNGMSNSSSRPPSEEGIDTTSPLSLTPPGMAGGIFPSIPSREDLINRIRERTMFGGGMNAGGANGGSPNGSPSGLPPMSTNGGFDLASFFPNIAKLSGMNPAALAGLLPPGFFPNVSPNGGAPTMVANGHGHHHHNHNKTENGNGHGSSSSNRKRSSDIGLKREEDVSNEDIDYPGSMVIDEDAEEINCEMGDDDEEMDANNGTNGGSDEYGDEMMGNSANKNEDDDGSEEPFLSLDSPAQSNHESPAASANGSRRSSMNIRKSSNNNIDQSAGNHHVESPLASLQQHFQNGPNNSSSSSTPSTTAGASSGGADLPALRSAISASPLNSLMYQKKLNNALRNKNTDASLMANFFYPNPLQQLQQVQMQLAAAAQREQQSQQQQRQREQLTNQRRKSSSAMHAPALNGFLKDLSMKREHRSPSPSSLLQDHHQHHHNNHHNHHGQSSATSNGTTPRLITTTAPSESGISGGNGSHISPTESSVGSSSASTASSAGQTSPTGILDTLAAVAASSATSPTSSNGGNGGPCPQCSVLKGRLALTENRCRFLESKTTSQESKISRLESRIGTLESNGRRYENEAHMLRDHCEQLERKVLDCQERVLRYLQGQQYDQDTTKQMLYDVLETCRVYKQPA